MEHTREMTEKRKNLLSNQNSDIKKFKKSEFYLELISAFSIIILTLGVFVFLNQYKLRVLAEEKLKHLAYHDPLTGLANRIYLEKRMDEAIKIAERHEERMATVFIDLDNFKPVNDKYGHAVGDYILKKIAKRLLENARINDTVSRFGGDEFIIIVTGVHKMSDIEIAVNKILSIIRQGVRLNGKSVFLTASVGVSIYPENGKRSKELMRKADMAMYKVKEKGGNNSQFVTTL